MSAERPNIVVFFWDNFGWGEFGCYGGGVLRGASTPRIDALAADRLGLDARPRDRSRPAVAARLLRTAGGL